MDLEATENNEYLGELALQNINIISVCLIIRFMQRHSWTTQGWTGAKNQAGHFQQRPVRQALRESMKPVTTFLVIYSDPF